MMNPFHPVFAILVFFIAFATAYLIPSKYKKVSTSARNESIDGLRGFLAIGVFIHHAAVWYQYLQVSAWEAPKSNLYAHLGQTSVSFFFMITSFLFITKILEAGSKPIPWNILFFSRFFRLVPMYLVSITALVIIVFETSNWQLNVPFLSLLKQLFYWITFTLPGMPQINASPYTRLINAQVVWSLPYEWLFYFSLPILAVFLLRKNVSLFHVLTSVAFIIAYCLVNRVELQHILSFIGGAIAPFIRKFGAKKTDFNSTAFTLLLAGALVSILFFPSPNHIVCKLLITLVFSLVALGNTVFGILKHTTLKLLGDISYSTYLIHGIFLFIMLYYGIGIDEAKKLSVLSYWLTIFAITPLVIVTSFLTFNHIEKPFMDYSKKLEPIEVFLNRL